MTDNWMAEMHEKVGERLLRLPEVINKVGFGRTEIYRRMKVHLFPQSRVLGPRCVVWVESEIDEWIRDVSRRPN